MKKIAINNIFKVKLIVTSIIFFCFILTPTINANTVPTVFNYNFEKTQIKEIKTTNYDPIYKLLIIAPTSFIDDLSPLVTHKNEVGMPTKLVSLDEVYDQMSANGRDDAEKIKYYIKYAIEEWEIGYVLLVGDFRKLPVRYCYNADVNSGFNEPRFISELYYADIYDEFGEFSSWDTNDNEIYGEWMGNFSEDPDIDLYPDIAVGRIACRNKFELKTMVDKIIQYETSTYNSEWFNRLVVCAGDTYPESLNPNWTGYEGEENTIKVMENMSQFDPVILWTSDGSFTGPRDIFRAINNGCGFLYFDGHANPYRWSTHPPNDPKTWVEGLNVISMSLLRNKDMLPVCVVGGCHNLQFDVHLGKLIEDPWYYYTFISECWGWKLTRKIGGGSIATLGCTGLGMTKEDKESFSGAGDYLEPSFFKHYGTNGVKILGDTWKATITDYLDTYPIDWNTPAAWDSAIDAKSVQQWALLGDPSLLIGGYQ